VKAKNVLRDEHGPGHVTPAGRSVFYDLFPRDKADELVIRATLLSGLERWLKNSKLTRAQAAKALRITQARVSDIKRGKIGQFSLDMLVRLASRAGLRPKLKLASKPGTVNNDRKEINECAETSRPDRTQGHSRNRKMAEGKSG
jgi:predicted XRE-type DNA-binding protein